MTLTLPYLIILLLPGFFSLWVYQGFSYENHDRRERMRVMVFVVMFGILSLCSFAILSAALSLAGAELSLPAVAEPSDLARPSFAVPYGVLSALALFWGWAGGMLTRRRLTPVSLLQRLGAKQLCMNPTHASDSALHAALQEMTKDGREVIILISREGGPVLTGGVYAADNLDTGEIVLRYSLLFGKITQADLEDLAKSGHNTVVFPDGRTVAMVPAAPDEVEELVLRLAGR